MPIRLDVQSLLERLEEVHALVGQRSVLLTDADGTLWSGDVGEDMVERLLRDRELHAAVEGPLRRLAEEAGLDGDAERHELLARIRSAFARREFSERVYYELSGWLLAGRSRSWRERWCSALVRDVDVRERQHQEMLAVLDWASSRNVPVCVVSASPAEVIEAAVALLGLRVWHVVGARAQVDEAGICLPRLASPLPYGEDKVKRAQQACSGREAIAAFGDSAFDVPMLETARLAVGVRPSDELVHGAAEQRLELVTLAPLG